MPAVVVELIGYVGSTLIVLSVTRTSILKLRLLGLAGSTGFILYGLLITKWPIVLTNVIISGVHLYFLNQFRSKKREYFRLLEVDPDSRYLLDFLQFYRADIARFQPGFGYRPAGDQLRVFILRDMVPAGLLIGSLTPSGVLHIDLDFVIPRYRDLQVGDFVFRRSHVFDGRGIERLETDPGNADHEAYLERMGFRREGDLYVRDRTGVRAG